MNMTQQMKEDLFDSKREISYYNDPVNDACLRLAFMYAYGGPTAYYEIIVDWEGDVIDGRFVTIPAVSPKIIVGMSAKEMAMMAEKFEYEISAAVEKYLKKR